MAFEDVTLDTVSSDDTFTTTEDAATNAVVIAQATSHQAFNPIPPSKGAHALWCWMIATQQPMAPSTVLGCGTLARRLAKETARLCWCNNGFAAHCMLTH